MIGPMIVPMPNTAMAWPWRCGGLICKSVACDSGISPAPATPCRARKNTSSPRLPAAPHSAEASVKPMTETRKIYLMPNRPASQPVSGIMIAAQTMYEVSAQAIWSSEADRLPWMCGRATLRIVLSTPCMMFASMIDIVIMPRFGTGVNASPLIDRPLNEPTVGPVAPCPYPHCGRDDCVLFLAEKTQKPRRLHGRTCRAIRERRLAPNSADPDLLRG